VNHSPASARPVASTDRRPAALLIFLLLAAAGYYGYAASLHAPVSDEAVFGRAAQEILAGDWSLSHWRVMKPPVVYYAHALSRLALGDSAFAGRAPGVLALLGCLWMLYRIGRRWLDGWVGLLAAAFLAFSPFAVEHLASGRTDPLALFFILWSIDLAGAGKIGWSGLAYATAFCARQLAALSFPMVLGLAIFAAYLAGEEKPRWPRLIWRTTWRFFRGTLPALLVLTIWSMFEKIPFAWLINEFQNKKYAAGAHLEVAFGAKLSHWLHDAIQQFFACPGLLAFAAAGALIGWIWLGQRLAGRWRGREMPGRVLLVIAAVFVTLFPLFNSLRFFTTYLRFMVPLMPWTALLAAWALLTLFHLIGGRPATLLASAVAPIILVLSVWGQARALLEWRAPLPEDDIPAAVAWIEANAAPDAILYTREYGPETDYATFGKRIKGKQMQDKLDQFEQEAARRLGREQFLYLRRPDPENWDLLLPPLLDPVFRLVPVANVGLRLGQLWRLEVVAHGGIAGEEIVYLQDRRLARVPLDCPTLGGLIARGLKDGGNAPEFAWPEECDLSPSPARLAWRITGLRLADIRVEEASFTYDAPALDWPALTIAGQLVIEGAAHAQAVFRVNLKDLEAYLRKKNKNLADLQIETAGETLIIRAQAAVLGRQLPVKAIGRLRLDGDQVHFALRGAEVGAFAAPGFALRYIEKQINPVLKLDLKHWALRPAAVELESGPAGGLRLTAELRPRAK